MGWRSRMPITGTESHIEELRCRGGLRPSEGITDSVGHGAQTWVAKRSAGRATRWRNSFDDSRNSFGVAGLCVPERPKRAANALRSQAFTAMLRGQTVVDF